MELSLGGWLVPTQFLLREGSVLGFLLTLTHLVLATTIISGDGFAPILKTKKVWAKR